MALIMDVRGHSPQWGKDCFIAPNATIVGDVVLGNHCSVWFNAVIRGDVNSIRIGDYCNIQDGAVIHCTYERTQTIIGNRVSIGHNAIVHGCTIHDNVLIGMGAIIMDGAVIHSNAIIGAGAVVLSGAVVEAGTIWAGNPARFIKAAGDKAAEISRIANNYPLYASWFKDNNL
ncbi:carbonic anhydrase/acetyltransferase-like protein (isoleucine patch superfamily) [Thermonema lapsum]|jgi:carbonic anhydrase/acetyltransferase-like protein (isoleucine patch superfamily)|uniref:Carbonic anhydrase/acetyltransferase-like protein (Isoleucine patch superfamily) n=1 Tax=Thermonema lapsum TaxID=28195 RepID=A0A846MS20_9BACT|nr:gamma carbonic anhydrase family protein [Thermonema lapsum]NIK74394.1 carbonic anhydrase/acetyltransferase-like protein (isoleucine patch superfamily) [Thermonema lapsum]